jgi:hypothetical protein
MKHLTIILFLIPFFVSGQSSSLKNTIEQSAKLERGWRYSVQKKVDAVQLSATKKSIDDLVWRMTVHNTEIVCVQDSLKGTVISLSTWIEIIQSHPKETYDIIIVCANVTGGQLQKIYYKINVRNE